MFVFVGQLPINKPDSVAKKKNLLTRTRLPKPKPSPWKNENEVIENR